MSDNYFRVGRKVFFFLSRIEGSVQRAWQDAQSACKDGGYAAIMYPISLVGPWHGCDILGLPRQSANGDYRKSLTWMWEHMTTHLPEFYTPGAAFGADEAES